MQPRLKPGLYVRATIRRVETAGGQAYVVKKGSEEAGAVYLSILRADGSYTVLSQAYHGDGERVWIRPLGDRAAKDRADAYFAKQMKFDPDLWILEIEGAKLEGVVDERIV